MSEDPECVVESAFVDLRMQPITYHLAYRPVPFIGNSIRCPFVALTEPHPKWHFPIGEVQE